MKSGSDGIKQESRSGRSLISVSVLCLVFILLSGDISLMAQGLSTYDGSKKSRGIELAGLYGWQWGGSFNGSLGEVDIEDTDAWGVELNVPVPKGIQAVLLYYRQDTQLNLEDYVTGTQNTILEMSVNYFQIGAIKGIRKGKALPFGMFTLGATLFDPVGSTTYDAEWLFSINLGLGVKFYASEKVGVRMQVNMLMPIQWGSGGVFWSPGSGTSVGISGGSAITQGFVGGGLFVII
jgi:hypothetical protein